MAQSKGMRRKQGGKCMNATGRWAVGISSVVGLGAIGYYGYRKATAPPPMTTVSTASPPASSSAQTSTQNSSPQAPAVVAVTPASPVLPAFLDESAPTAYNGLIGPGPGNQPNGSYTLSTQFSVPASGSYTFEIAADDCAVVILDGKVLGAVDYNHSFGQNRLVKFSRSLSVGTHALVIIMYNNNMGNRTSVPYRSGTDNPTGLRLLVLAPNGTTVVTTASAAGWHYSGYVTQHPHIATPVDVPLLS